MPAVQHDGQNLTDYDMPAWEVTVGPITPARFTHHASGSVLVKEVVMGWSMMHGQRWLPNVHDNNMGHLKPPA